MNRFLFLFLFLMPFCFAKAQQGMISGKVTDRVTGEEIVGAAVFIDGTTIGAATDFMGEFRIANVNPGTYNVKCQSISYEPQVINAVVVGEGKDTFLDIKISSAELKLEEVQVVARVNRESENMLLLEQKGAMVSKESIGAQQLSVQGISDASSAVSRITGISQQEGSQTINVRGLGDRYNSTTLNGLPLPSNHAEFKNIDLKLFPSDIIGSVGVEKNFTSNLNADVAGANIDVVSKKHTGDAYLQFGVGTGYNMNLTQPSSFFLQDGPGFTGFDNFKRPASIQTYAFTNSWDPVKKTAQPDMDLSLSGGKTFQLGDGKLNLFATASFDNEYSYNKYLERKVNGSDDNRMDLAGDEFGYKTQTTAMLNLNYNINRNDFYFNSFFLNSSDQELKEMRGYIMDVVGDIDQEEALLRRSDFERNVVMVNQFIGNHELNNGYSLNWKVGYNHIDNILPDRRKNILLRDNQNVYTPSTNDAANNHRYFHDLNEDELAATIDVSKTFGQALSANRTYRGKITIGASGRMKDRSFEAFQYNHGLDKNRVEPIDINNVDGYFNNERLQAGYFSVKTFFGTLNKPSIYEGNQVMGAGFLSLEYALTPRLSTLLGVRFEALQQEVSYETTLKDGKNDFAEMNAFPSLSFKYELNETQNLRFASSMNYTLPQFKETAPFLFEGITDATVGNPYLYPSKNYNGELKWEWFPSGGELFSVAGFGKYIQDPINKFVTASASDEFSYANTGGWAYVYGVEVEAKKNLFSHETESGFSRLSLAANLSLMETYQELDKDKVRKESKGSVIAAFNTDREELEGAAPLLMNANLVYSRQWNNRQNAFSASIGYAYTSERLYLIGYSSLGNQYDSAFSDLNVVLKSKFKNLGVSLSAKNLLNPDFVRVQKNPNMEHEVRSYTKGVKIGLGLTYNF